jgi:hypothetical protein
MSNGYGKFFYTESKKKLWRLYIQKLEEQLEDETDKNFDRYSSVTRKGGRPFKYTPKEIADNTVAYFKECLEKETPFSWQGLSLYLGLSKRELYNLINGRKGGKCKNYEKFVPPLKKGMTLITAFLEHCGLEAKNPYFFIFIMKNLGYEDKTKINFESDSQEGLSKAKRKAMRNNLMKFKSDNNEREN